MCGITGYIGSHDAVRIVLEGLTRLEYRGYDSAGVSFLDEENKLIIEKEVGKITQLKKCFSDRMPKSQICIGHTRWATHGTVTKPNAHPHSNGDIVIIHNGIIENYTELKNILINDGEIFETETDSEVFLKLVSRINFLQNDLEKSVIAAFKKIEGNSAFVVMDRKADKIIAIKRAAPLVCGTSSKNKDILISSDPYALIGFVEELFFPEDEILCVANSNGELNFYDLEGNPSQSYERKEQNDSLTPESKGPYDHYMLKEIHEQPDLIRKFVHYYIQGDGKKELFKLANIRSANLHIAACGTAWHAGLVIRDLVEKYNGIVTRVELASEFRYRNPMLNKGDLGLFISQSGETADTLAAQELCKESGVTTVSIVNTEGSTLSRSSDQNLFIKAGQEIGVASTKAFTNMVLTGFLASKAIKGDFERKEIKEEILVLADKIDELLSDSFIEKIIDIANKVYLKRGFLFTGRGKYFPIALEGALKLKEIAYVHAEGYAAGELKHGPIALIDEDMVNIAIVGPELYDKTISNIEEVRARKGVIITIGPKDDSKLKDISDYFIGLDFSGLNELTSLYVNVVNQLFSYYVAKTKGTDIDQPRNLAKSVTVE